MTVDHVPPFAQALRGAFYLDEDAIRAAIERRGSFNVVHLGSYFKADIFVAKDDPGRVWRWTGAGVSLSAVLRRASSRSRGWSDALGVLKVAGTSLDFEYLQRVCGLLGVGDLLDRLRREPNA